MFSYIINYNAFEYSVILNPTDTEGRTLKKQFSQAIPKMKSLNQHLLMICVFLLVVDISFADEIQQDDSR
jgi:hypothetical protein